MINTVENKTKLFAIYWGTKTLIDLDNKGELVNYPIDQSNMYRIDESHLKLKPLSSITDEDALFFINLGYNGYLNVKITDRHNDGVTFEYEYKSSKRRRKFSYRFNYVSQYSPNVAQLDFLRSKGYALPWMELSVEKQIEYGWIKLKEN